MVRPTANMARIPKKIASIVEKALNGDEVVLDRIDLSSRVMLNRLKKDGLIDISSKTVIKRRPMVNKPKKRNGYKNSVWLALTFNYAIIGYAYIMAYFYVL